MNKKSIQYLKQAAGKLRDGKLKRLGAKELTDALDGMMSTLGLDTKEEAIIFAALFDRSCAGRCSDLDDVATYFGVSQLDVMEYVPAVKSLLKKGFIAQTDLSECRLVRQNFMVTNYVIGCVLDNQKPEFRDSRILEKEFDRYDFCKLVDSQIQDDDVTAEAMLHFVENIEDENSTMPLVKDLRKIISDLPDRVLFYEICKDFVEYDGSGRSDVNRTLRDMYEAYGVRFKVKRSLLDGSNSLVRENLIELSGNKEDMTLTTRGKKLFLGEDFGAFDPKSFGLNIYSFVRTVQEYVHSRDHDVENDQAMERLSERLNLLEDSNKGSIAVLSHIRDVIADDDMRALFYIGCDACANGDELSITRELGSLYPVKERNKALKEFREETHKLQRLDLMEMVTHSSLFGEYTSLRLTDKGKELYFGEDASLYIEKPDSKSVIRASEIKEKSLFFSPAETERLNMVGDSLREDNYSALVSRLEEKGLSKGIAVLLYGAPGTGKTESVMQWARATGRDIIHVDISASKSLWYGESEKIIKEIFARYKRLCKRSTLKPILLFNEADAIFSSRKTGNNSSIDQTENAIQNIILEEMENLEGILIATTNLAENLDKAFERRFLFKIQFDKPSVEAKQKIWLSKLPSLSAGDAMTLSTRFDFSGGEIDNIVRKALMAEVLHGEQPSFGEIETLCSEEKLKSRSSHSRVGF
ncbi:MAG: ATP-binding protein [Lachnoclostridium sp.]|nr:ATP-binding protein [Lachnoclostridium sp.]